jgi:hypothetical protein
LRSSKHPVSGGSEKLHKYFPNPGKRGIPVSLFCAGPGIAAGIPSTTFPPLTNDMAILLNHPHRIIPTRVKRYEAHYHIPAGNALVVPMKNFGEEVLCDIRWEDSNGELKIIQNAMFVYDNLIPLRHLPDTKLFELWNHYYGESSAEIAAKANQ